MPRVYDNAFARCPFFESSDKKNIVCEGLSEESTLHLNFESEEARDRYRKTFCDADYEECEINKMLEKKYEE